MREDDRGVHLLAGMVDGPRGDGADELPSPLVRLDLHVEQALDLRHHLVVRLLVPLHDTVVEPLLLHPHVHVLHVPVEELHVLLFLHEAARHVELVLGRLEEPPEEDVAKHLHLVVPAAHGVLLQPLELVAALAERVDLVEDCLRVQATEHRRLRGVEERHAHLSRARPDAPLVDGVGVALGPHLLDGCAEKPLRVGVEALRRLAQRVEVGLLDGGERRDDGADAAGVAVRVRLAHPREDGEDGGDLGGVRGDVAPHLGSHVRVVDEPLLLVAAQIRHAHQIEPTAEARELDVLAERVEVKLVGAPHHHAVELHVLGGERDLARLHRELEVLEGVERALEQIAELEQASRRVDELPFGLVEGHRLERRGQGLERAVHRDLPLARVDAELRPDGHGARAVAARDEVSLDLHVLEHLGVRPVVRGEQRLEHLLRPQTYGTDARCRLVDRRRRLVWPLIGRQEEPFAVGGRDEEQRVVAHLDHQLRVDLLVGQVGVGVDPLAAGLAAVVSEAERAADRLLRREDPVEAVERPVVQRRVVLERRHHALGDGRLR